MTETETETETVSESVRGNGTENESEITVQAQAHIIVRKSDTDTRSIVSVRRGAMSVTERESAGKRRKGTGKGGIEKKRSRLVTNLPEAAAGAAMIAKRAIVTEGTNTKSPKEAKKGRMLGPNLSKNQKVLNPPMPIRHA